MEIQSAKLIITVVDETTGELITREATLGDSGLFILLKERDSNGRWKLNTTELFVKKSREIHGNKYDYSKVKYINNSTKVCITCPEHGEFWQRPNDHISKKAGCPLCKGTHLYTKEEFIEKANKIHNNYYDYSLVEYINNKTHIKIICPIHGEFELRPDKHLRGQGCPKCKKSHGETLIEKYLLENDIEYKSQYEIPIDVSINFSGKAYIDFYLPNYNLFIEYNGELHYINRPHFGNKYNDFERLSKRDIYVKNYCKENNIRLLEIPYTELNILEYLIKFLNNPNND